jgi:hypothetical protein
MRSVVDYFSVQIKHLRLSVELKYISLHIFILLPTFEAIIPSSLQGKYHLPQLQNTAVFVWSN